jgi:hypothetical protein
MIYVLAKEGGEVKGLSISHKYVEGKSKKNKIV